TLVFSASLNQISSSTAIQIGFYNSTTGSIIKLETATTVTVAILGVNSSTSTTIVEKAVTLKPHTFALEPAQQTLALLVGGSAGVVTFTPKFDANYVPSASTVIGTIQTIQSSIISVGGYINPLSNISASVTGTSTIYITAIITPGSIAGSARVSIPVTYNQYGYLYTATEYIDVIVSQPSIPITLYNANGSWVTTNVLSYKVTYDVVGFDLQSQSVELVANGRSVGVAKAGDPIYATFTDLWNALGGKDGFLTLRHVGGTSSVTVPITFYSVDSELKSSYVSGEPINDVTGEITTVKSGQELSTATIGLSLVAVWKDEDGVAHATNLGNITANRVADDKTTATFAIKAGDIRFTVLPAGNVYLVSKNIADDMVDGEVYGVSVAKYAYKTITITQGKLVANPSTVNAPAQNKEIYLYDQFGYPLANTPIKVQYGYKDADGNVIAAATATTATEGKVTLNFPQPYAYGTYTATISTVKSPAYVDGVVALTVSYAGGFSLGDMVMTGSIGSVTIPVISTTASISKLWISVDDTNKVLKTYYYSAANDDLVDYKLKPTGYTTKFEYANDGACGVTVTDFYWVGNSKNVTLTGTALQGGTFTVTAKAELADGSIVTASKQYIVKAYRIDSITPASTTYGTATTVKIVVKDWYGGYVDDITVQLISENEYNQVGPNQFTLIPENFGTYSFTIPAGAVPGDYAVYIGTVNYSKPIDKYFTVAPIEDLNVKVPATVNAMSKFDVTVTDKSGGAVNGAWFVVKGPKGSVVNGKFSVDTSTFSDGSKLGVYTLVVISSDGKHAGTATFEIVAPSTITPTAVTNGISSTFVVQMTSTGLNANQIKFRDTKITVLQVESDNTKVKSMDSLVFGDRNITTSGQTATITVVAHKQRECSNAVVRLLYGNFVLGSVAVEHPQLSFVNTGTLYAGDVVPVQVKLVDALGNPVKGAVIKLYQLGYYEYTATTNAEGIAEFGNITLSVAGNMVAELVFGPDQQKVEDYRLKGQTDNTNYKVTAQILPARPAQGLKVTVTPTIVDAGKDALLTLTLVGADDKPVETGKNVVVTI
ncbi:MAG: DUF4198 domain-containing protein, partial [Acetomicrobium flavidum]|uniref:hypothetical protein n=1 Tax=Acetomicrobium flavidum TaxID=49896 RepID=UPI0016B75AD3|nr:DUF4198 domain-containing protein [Acetomicrobium flavidum]